MGTWAAGGPRGGRPRTRKRFPHRAVYPCFRFGLAGLTWLLRVLHPAAAAVGPAPESGREKAGSCFSKANLFTSCIPAAKPKGRMARQLETSHPRENVTASSGARPRCEAGPTLEATDLWVSPITRNAPTAVGTAVVGKAAVGKA